MIAIVTDSSVGYSTAEVTSRGILSVVPLNYQIGNGFYEEYASDRNGDFMTPMAQFSPCKTAQPNFDNFLRTFRTLTERGCDVICIVLSEALSGTYSSAKFAAQQAGGNIYVLDSGTIGAGMHLLVDEAVNMVKGRPHIGPPKTVNSVRDVPVPPSVQPCAVFLREQAGKFVWDSPIPGQPVNPSHFRDKYRNALLRIPGVRMLTPHSGRHTYVSQLQALGVDMETIQSMVGHADIEMTQHYLHVQEESRQAAAEKFSKTFGISR